MRPCFLGGTLIYIPMKQCLQASLSAILLHLQQLISTLSNCSCKMRACMKVVLTWFNQASAKKTTRQLYSNVKPLCLGAITKKNTHIYKTKKHVVETNLGSR